jgi:hypothetical protein
MKQICEGLLRKYRTAQLFSTKLFENTRQNRGDVIQSDIV